MMRASIGAGVAALCLALLPARGEAAHYVLSSYGTLSWNPPKTPTVTYKDTASGSFDVADGASIATLQSGLTNFSLTVHRETSIYQFGQPPVQYEGLYDLGVADLSSFTFDPSLIAGLYFHGTSGLMTVDNYRSSFTFGSSQGDRPTQGVMTITLAAVPEPASWAMMVAGFGLVGWTLRGRARRAGTLPA